jgi:hypothetical protein
VRLDSARVRRHVYRGKLFGKAEVLHFDTALSGQHHIGRLQITVNDPRRVRGFERLRNFSRDASGESTGCLADGTECSRAWHNSEGRTASGLALDLKRPYRHQVADSAFVADNSHRDDVGLRQASSSGADLTK